MRKGAHPPPCLGWEMSLVAEQHLRDMMTASIVRRSPEQVGGRELNKKSAEKNKKKKEKPSLKA